jgi:hypothetical protein
MPSLHGTEGRRLGRAPALRDELELRRRHVCNQLDRRVASFLSGRVNHDDREQLVDDVERLLQEADDDLLRKFAQ